MRHWIPAFFWALLIFIGSSIPGHDIPGSISMASNFLHIAEYAILGVLSARALKRSSFRFLGWQVMALAFAICVLYGVSDEMHQVIVPGRSVNILDIIADAIGGGIGVSVWFLFTSSEVWK